MLNMLALASLIVTVAAEKEKISHWPNRQDNFHTVLSARLLVVVQHASRTGPGEGFTSRSATGDHTLPLQLFLFCTSPKPSLTICTTAETCFRSARNRDGHSGGTGRGRGGVHFSLERDRSSLQAIYVISGGWAHGVNQSAGTPLLSK